MNKSSKKQMNVQLTGIFGTQQRRKFIAISAYIKITEISNK
jgi:hypothetical protein